MENISREFTASQSTFLAAIVGLLGIYTGINVSNQTHESLVKQQSEQIISQSSELTQVRNVY